MRGCVLMLVLVSCKSAEKDDCVLTHAQVQASGFGSLADARARLLRGDPGPAASCDEPAGIMFGTCKGADGDARLVVHAGDRYVNRFATFRPSGELLTYHWSNDEISECGGDYWPDKTASTPCADRVSWTECYRPWNLHPPLGP